MSGGRAMSGKRAGTVEERVLEAIMREWPSRGYLLRIDEESRILAAIRRAIGEAGHCVCCVHGPGGATCCEKRPARARGKR